MPLSIANYAIADSIVIIYKIITIKREGNLNDELKDYMAKSHLCGQSDFDHSSIRYLNILVKRLDEIIGEYTSQALDDIKNDLAVFGSLNTSDQQTADALFSKIFRQFRELISAYRHFLFGTHKV